MYRFTLAQLFGSGASQTATTLTISKSDLPGLTPSATNTAESLMVGLLTRLWLQLEGQLTDELGQVLTDELGKPLTYDDRNGYDWLNFYRWKIYWIPGRKVDSLILELRVTPPTPIGAPINPNLFN